MILLYPRTFFDFCGIILGRLWPNWKRGALIDTDILTVEDLVDILKQSRESIIKLLESGALPGRRVGDAWYVTKRQLVAYIEGDEPEPVKKKTVPPAEGNILPFGGDWKCMRCATVNDVERVECSDCGAARMTPLMGFRLK